MNRNRIDWLAGVAVAILVAVAYLSGTPSGRALTLTAVGFAPGMSRAEIEARIGGPGVASRHAHTVSINIRHHGPTVSMAEMMDRSAWYSRAYRGPVFVVEVEYNGRRQPTAGDIRLRAGREWVLAGGLTAMLLLAIGTAEVTRRCRRALAARHEGDGDSRPPAPPDRSWDIRGRDAGAGLAAVVGIAVLSLIATPTGRALQYAIGILPGVAEPSDVRNLIRAGYDVGGPQACRFCTAFPLDIDPADPPILDGPPTEMPREAGDRYAGPLFAIELEYPDFSTNAPVAVKVVPDFHPDGILTLLAVLLIGVGVGAMSRRGRRVGTG